MMTSPKRHKWASGLSRRRDGLTLVEMIVVLAIIAVMAALIVPNVIGRLDQAKVTAAKSDLQTLATALRTYRLDNGSYPTSEQGLRALAERPTLPPEPIAYPAEPYIADLPQDPWGRDYVYRSPGQSGAYDLLTLGKDGEEGGEGLDADLTDKTR